MNRCPLAFDTIIDFYERRLDAAAMQRVREHLAPGCSVCVERLDWAKQFLPALHTAVSVPEQVLPEAMLANARNLARANPYSEAQRSATRSKNVPAVSLPVRIAQLLFDSRQSPSAAGARSQHDYSFRKLYAAGDYYVDLWEECASTGCYLIGQVLPRNGGDPIAPMRASLTAADGSSVLARPESSEFHLSLVTAGTYQLRLTMGEEEILLTDVAIGLSGS